MRKSVITLAVAAALAFPCIAGTAVPNDGSEAHAVVQDVTFAKGLWLAQQARTLTDPGQQATAARDAISLLQPYVDKGSMLASWALGYLYLTGSGVPEDRSLGITLYEQSAGGGNRVAAKWLAGALHHDRPRTPVEIAENNAAEHFRQLAEAPPEAPEAPAVVAVTAGLAAGVEQAVGHAAGQAAGKAVHAVAVQSEQRASAPAVVPVQTVASTDPAPVDADARLRALQARVASLEQEISELRQRDQRMAAQVEAEQLNREAMLAIARRDYAAAIPKLQRAIALEHPAAEANLASLYLNGSGVARDPREALRLYEKAAAAGNPVAAENIANIYEYGVGVPRDHDRAAKAFRRAADLGSPTALHALERIGVTNYVPAKG